MRAFSSFTQIMRGDLHNKYVNFASFFLLLGIFEVMNRIIDFFIIEYKTTLSKNLPCESVIP